MDFPFLSTELCVRHHVGHVRDAISVHAYPSTLSVAVQKITPNVAVQNNDFTLFLRVRNLGI